MKADLSELSLEELWALFPIILKEHNPDYKAWYEEEKQQIISKVKPENLIRISHIGSTAVKGLTAKPIVDILLEINGACGVSAIIEVLKTLGWRLMSQEDDPVKLSFNKGYTPEGFADRVYHLHVRYFGNWSELYFRDFLIAHPDVAGEYERLKLKLWKQYEHDRDGYTEAKTDFVRRYSDMAKVEFNNRYLPEL
ncbi:GrpB family protein [Eubacterium sp.]|uniref:GrpB family protein n=1 Tax=Eubacterium sp. TaxID=142586 RepID=UPI0026DFD56F|nr:GrpB family protein [Eubacterium sp.]MDO5433790.1 GrpB family protein [Eubacterium sp.]